MVQNNIENTQVIVERSLPQKGEIFWIHLARAIAIVMVVLIHASADLFYEFGAVPMRYWWASNFYQSISRIGVPFFFMVSGLLLLGKHESLSYFFKRRVLKVLIPLLFWSVFFIAWRKFFFHESLDFSKELILWFNKPTFPHLWFLYAILGVYLSYPVIRVFIQNANSNLVWYFIGIWLLIAVLFPSFQAYTGISINSEMVINLGLFTGYLGYTVIGYALGTMPRNNRLVAAMIPIAVISPFATLLRTYIATESSGSINESFYHYLSPNVIFASIASFYLLRFIGSWLEQPLPENFRKIIITLSKYSFIIYLIHPVFIQFLAAGTFGYRLSAFSHNPWFSIPAVTLLSVMLSFVIIFFVKKVKFPNIIFP